MEEQEKQHLENLRQVHLRRLRVLEEKAALFGLNTPPEILIEIEDIQVRLHAAGWSPDKSKMRTGVNTFFSERRINYWSWILLSVGGIILVSLSIILVRFFESDEVTGLSQVQTTSLTADISSESIQFAGHGRSISGVWEENNGVLKGSASLESDFAVILLPDEVDNDYIVAFQTRILEGSLSELMLHVSQGRYVRIYIHSKSNIVGIGDGSLPGGGGAYKVANMEIENDRWYTVSVAYNNGSYIVTIDDQEIVKYEDDTSALSMQGVVGFATNGQAEFRNVSIK
jgi:hypothetical protein